MQLSDVFDRDLDVAIAAGALPDSSLVARPLGHGQFVTVAAPACFGEMPRPSRPDELHCHRCVTYTRPDGREEPWNFETQEAPVQIEPHASLRSDDMHHIIAMAIAGLGIAQLPMFVIASHLADGRLERLLRACELRQSLHRSCTPPLARCRDAFASSSSTCKRTNRHSNSQA
jgi:DNA-binding transcriptional LysR family regulator